MFSDFYLWKIEALDKEWNSHYGFEVDEIWLFSFWNDPELGLTKRTKSHLKLDIPSEENMWKLINIYIDHKKSLRPKQKKPKPKKKKKLDYQRLEQLAKPKERIKIGLMLLNLKQFFPRDKILRRMIIEEF